MPLILIWPHLDSSFSSMLWSCDAIWLISIVMDFFTIRYNLVSRDNFDIAIDYLYSEFLIDLVATLPSLISKHKNNLIFLRLLHIIHLQKSNFILTVLLEFLLPYKRITSNRINISVKYAYAILLWCHFCVILWLFGG